MRIIGFFSLFIFLLVGCSGNNSKSENTENSTNADVAVGLEIGNKAPELVFNTPDGTPIALSSLEGKMVLIDFWAGWCPPCRRENPNIVKAYEKYKDKEFKYGEGFTVYGVSFDNNKEQWLEAIEADSLVWKNHVSDLKGWSSEAAQIYQIAGIPTNYLIDSKGIIIEKNLRDEALHSFLKDALK